MQRRMAQKEKNVWIVKWLSQNPYLKTIVLFQTQENLETVCN